ncbi:hypothetical protein [Campylobacter sp. RM12651]|uniref:hypothetical protein n=1 Tax=Campylobacter sp. RM12651 TaxID=1660079 RepID=UPI001EFBCC71|nr:hypothetical protein [Campylobacter sp. RM12651]ULO04546.1 hypothetical protein AVBRAN_a0064 [Campylobacter sp. RM12651]
MNEDYLFYVSLVFAFLGFLASYFTVCYFERECTKDKFLENFDIEEDIYSQITKKKVLKIKADTDYKQKEYSLKEKISTFKIHERV